MQLYSPRGRPRSPRGLATRRGAPCTYKQYFRLFAILPIIGFCGICFFVKYLANEINNNLVYFRIITFVILSYYRYFMYHGNFRDYYFYYIILLYIYIYIYIHISCIMDILGIITFIQSFSYSYVTYLSFHC